MARTYGPWTIEGRLGTGGMGVVYRVRHAETGALAALKTVEARDPRARRALRREAAALRLLDHPSIVPLVEDGTDGPEPWYAMALLEGPSLGAVLTPPSATPMPAVSTFVLAHAPPGADVPAAPADADPLPPRVAWTDALLDPLARVAELCHALCHLHAAGLVHCDLKPDNVVIVDGRAVLLDFGLVATRGPRTDRESMLHDLQIAGTAAYMSPERAAGAAFDARADLYAVGCLLYRVITGFPPFISPSPVQLMLAHQYVRPTPLSDRVAGVPRAIESLVDELLRKDPRERPGHAQRVLGVLAEVGVAIPDWPLPAVAPLYHPLFRGREAALAELEAAVARLGGAGSAVWVSGESGAGKSRLVGALLGGLGHAGPRIASGGCSAVQSDDGPVGGNVPLELFAEPLRDVAERAIGDKMLAAEVAPAFAVLAPWLPFARAVPGVDAARGPAPETAEAARHRVYQAVIDVLTARYGPDQLLLVLEDLQWADELSVGALAAVLRRLPERPWLVIGVLRSDDDDAHLRDLLVRHGTVHRVERLAEPDVRAIVCDMLGQSDPPAPLLAWVERHAAGNPLFVGECLRSAAADGILAVDVEGRWAFRGDDAVARQPGPESLDRLIGARLDALAPDALHLARAAAVVGRGASLDLVVRVAGLSDAAFDRATGELDRRGVLQTGDDGVAFTHDRLAERMYGAIPPELRRELHARTADALDAGGDPGRLARHREQAGDLDRARVAYVDAADRAVRGLALREAEQRYRDAIRLSSPPERWALALARVERVVLVQGRGREARAELEALLAELADRQPALRAQALSALGRTLSRGPDGELALQCFAEAQALAERVGRPDIAVHARSDAGAVLVRLGRPAEGIACHRAALDQVGADGPPLLIATLEQRLASALNTIGQDDAASALLDRAVATFAAHGALTSEAQARSVRANVSTYQGAWAAAAADYQAALALQRRIGNRLSEGVLLGNWASLLTRQSRYVEAEAQFREALAIHRETGDRRFEGIVLRSLASLGLLTADFDRVNAILDEAERALTEVGDLLWVAHCAQVRAKVHRYRGAYERAQEVLDRAIALYRSIPVRSELADALAHQVQLILARGGDPAPVFAELLAITEGAGEASVLGVARELGNRLMALRRDGKALLAGEDPDDLPAPVRDAIVAQQTVRDAVRQA